MDITNVGDLEFIIKDIKAYAENKETAPFKDIDGFFKRVLSSFYYDVSSATGIIDKNALNFIYRISDLIPKEKREKILVYKHDKDYQPNNAFDTLYVNLEGWRKEWKKENSNISKIKNLEGISDQAKKVLLDYKNQQQPLNTPRNHDSLGVKTNG